MNRDRISNASSGYDSFLSASIFSCGISSGTYRPPSDARPSSRISVKRRAVALPRVETYCTLFLPLLFHLLEPAQLLGRRLGVRLLRDRFLRRRLGLRLLRRQRSADQQEKQQPHNSSSSRIRVTAPTTVESFSMRAIAWLTFFSSAWWVSMTISTRFSPLRGSFCTIASIEIFESARMRVTSASTPGLSWTCRRR